jgi:hypothetical protein
VEAPQNTENSSKDEDKNCKIKRKIVFLVFFRCRILFKIIANAESSRRSCGR